MESYVNAEYSRKGAEKSSSHLLQNAEVCQRVAELRATITAAVVAGGIKAKIGNKVFACCPG